jgi:3'-phosphoadenosine 5'-phosphosulfate (PAPS) 3'-phosphatase
VTTEDSAALEIAAGAALAGGRAAGAYYGSDDLGVRDKSAGGDAVAAADTADDPVTLADHAANDAILDYLRERTAEPVLSEESRPPDAVSDAERLWIVDPLDGTKEFIARNGEFSVMVGLAERGSALLGAVYQPAIGRLYLGDVNRGAWLVQNPDTASETRSTMRIHKMCAHRARRGRSLRAPGPVPEGVGHVRSRGGTPGRRRARHRLFGRTASVREARARAAARHLLRPAGHP